MINRDANIHLAKVYLMQAKLTKHRNWSFVLLSWAANCRRRAMQPERIETAQMDLFA